MITDSWPKFAARRSKSFNPRTACSGATGGLAFDLLQRFEYALRIVNLKHLCLMALFCYCIDLMASAPADGLGGVEQVGFAGRKLTVSEDHLDGPPTGTYLIVEEVPTAEKLAPLWSLDKPTVAYLAELITDPRFRHVKVIFTPTTQGTVMGVDQHGKIIRWKCRGFTSDHEQVRSAFGLSDHEYPLVLNPDSEESTVHHETQHIEDLSSGYVKKLEVVVQDNSYLTQTGFIEFLMEVRAYNAAFVAEGQTLEAEYKISKEFWSPFGFIFAVRLSRLTPEEQRLAKKLVDTLIAENIGQTSFLDRMKNWLTKDPGPVDSHLPREEFATPNCESLLSESPRQPRQRLL
jgi:hypothetical protein